MLSQTRLIKEGPIKGRGIYFLSENNCCIDMKKEGHSEKRE